MADQKGGTATAERGGKQELSQEFQHLLSALAGRAMSKASDRVGGVTDKLSSAAEGGGGPAAKAIEKVGEKTAEGKSPLTAGMSAGAEGLKEKVKGVFGGGKKKRDGGNQLKVTNIVESIDIGAPIDVVYNQWTQFQDWSNFMKKVESAEQSDETKVNFKAQVFWSHRSWEGTVIDQVPNERIVWRSKGEKGRVEGAVTFHELAPSLTRVLVVLEYYPQGFFEQTGNLWRAQGRRARLELKHFRRHVMTRAVLHADDLEGWRGEIHDGEVTRSHDDVVREESDDNNDDSDDGRDADDTADDADDRDDAEDRDDDTADDDDERDPEDRDDDMAGDAEDRDDEYDDDDERDDAPEDEAEDTADEDMEDDEADEPRRPSRRRERVGAGSGRSR